jgi:hypothetical protein
MTLSDTDFSNLTYPQPSPLIFDKMLWTDWYDGVISGLVMQTEIAKAFRLDILAWDARQTRRIFALSPFEVRRFDEVVALLNESGPPTWPTWDPRWPLNKGETEALHSRLERLLRSAGDPEYVISSEARFEEIFAMKELNASSRELLPSEFAGLNSLGDFDYWANYLEP